MKNYERMVELRKKESREKEEAVIREIKRKYRVKEKIRVKDLVEKFHLSRAYFYNNKAVKQVLMEYQQKQEGTAVKNPNEDSILRALRVQVKYLELKLEQSVPKTEYEELQGRYDRLVKKQKKQIFDSL